MAGYQDWQLGAALDDHTGAGLRAGGVNIQSMLRRAMAQSMLDTAQGYNQFASQPLIQPAAWVTATAYAIGQSCSNAGNNYICNATITSSAAAPSATTNGPITDGSGSWYYAGPAYVSAAGAPTTTVTATRYNAGSTSWVNTNAAGGLCAVNNKDITNFNISAGSDGAGTGSSYSWGPGTLGQVGFMCDAAALQIVVAATSVPGLCVWARTPGGIWSPLTLGIIAPNPSAYNYYQIVWPSRGLREYLVEMPSGATQAGISSFYGVLCNDFTSKVFRSPPSPFRLGIVGTSYIAGNAILFPTAALGIGPQIAKALGCTQYWCDQQSSGTGYVTPGASYIYNSSQRLPQLTVFNPDIVMILGGGINDINAVSISGAVGGAAGAAAHAIEQAAALLYYQAIRAALPNALILVGGSEAGSTGPSAAIFNMEQAVADAVAAFADPYCVFMPESSTIASKAAISGNGNVSATNGSGNADIFVSADGIHTVMAGSNYLAARLVAAARRAVASL